MGSPSLTVNGEGGRNSGGKALRWELVCSNPVVTNLLHLMLLSSKKVF